MSHDFDGTHSTTHQCLLYSLRGCWDPPALDHARRLATGTIDWALWLRLAQSGQLAPILHATLRGQQWLPPEVAAPLRQRYLRNAMRNSLLLPELAALISKLGATSIPAILLKGAALVATAYDGAAVRPMADQDLLVRPVHLRAAQLVLKDQGYVVDSLDPWPGFSLRYRQVLEYRRPVHETLSHLVDLHWGIVDVPYYSRIPIDDWFARARTAQIEGIEVSVPSAEDHLLCLCSHLVLHERYEPPLLRYCDIAALITRIGEGMNWDSILQRAADWRLVIPLQRTVSQLEARWAGTVPASITRAVARLRPSRAEQRIHRWVIDRHRNPAADVLLFVATTPGLTRKARLLLEQAFPSPAYMRLRYEPRHPGLWPLAYLRRAFLTFLYLRGHPR